MSRKHFEAIARVLREQVESAETPEAHSVLIRTAELLAYEFAGFNHHFNRSRFLNAADCVG